MPTSVSFDRCEPPRMADQVSQTRIPTRVNRLVTQRWLQPGTSEGQWRATEGTPQEVRSSSLLANIPIYVFDLWANISGDVAMPGNGNRFRFADEHRQHGFDKRYDGPAPPYNLRCQTESGLTVTRRKPVIDGSAVSPKPCHQGKGKPETVHSGSRHISGKDRNGGRSIDM